MANIKSQIKRNRQNLKRKQRNRGVRAEINTRTRAALHATANEQDASEQSESLRLAIKSIDKAAQKGVLHKNTAARKKRRLLKKINA